MRFGSGYSHPSSTLPWRSLLPHLLALLLLHLGSAQIRLVAPSFPVTAIVGQDVVLRCHLSPCKDAWSSDIRWIQHRSAGIVHHFQNGVDLEQMEEYKGRTELLRDGLSDGNLDLHITAVTSSDSGLYSCTVEDGADYAEAVVNLEVSDPFSQIVHPWKVALAVVLTLLLGSFVIIVFLHRKRAAQRRELKSKDTQLADQAERLESKDTMLKQHAVTLAVKAEGLKKQSAKLGLCAPNLKKHIEELVKLTEALGNSMLKKDTEEMDASAADLKKKAAKLDSCAADLKDEAAKLVEQTEEFEKENLVFKEQAEEMRLHAENLKKQPAELVKLTEAFEKGNSGLKKDHEDTDTNAADLTEKLTAESVEQMEEVVVESEELDKPSEE